MSEQTGSPSHANDKNLLNDLALLEIKALAEKTPVTIQVNPMTAFLVIAQLQLALRHPQNQGPAKEATLEFTHLLRRQICGPGDPIDTLIGMGFDERFDRDAGK